ncbi:MAG: hypothetical protein WCR72_01680 [Bacteroidota bacterium]
MQTSKYPLSRILSYILHPLLIPTLVTSALMLNPGFFSIALPSAVKFWFISIVFIFTVGIPLCGMFILLKFKVINSIEQKQRTERIIPLLLGSTSYMALLYSLRSTGIPPVFLYVLYAATLALLTGLLINMLYKISLHTLGWGALTATLASISLQVGAPLLSLIIASVVLSGLAGYARLKQNAHNQTQIYLGYVAGVSIIIIMSLIG